MATSARLANRVFQLESHALDNEFDKIVDQFVENLDIPLMSEEFKLLIKAYIYKNYINDRTTIGMKAFNTSLYEASKSSDDESLESIPGRYKVIILTASKLILPYLTKRHNQVENLIRQGPMRALNISWPTFEHLNSLLKSLSIINFLIFLRTGRYPVLQERILGLMPGMSEDDYYNNVARNKYQMELISRDIIWKALAEFLTIIIPYINFVKLKNYALRLTGMMPIMNTETKLSDKISKRDHVNCAICNRQPFNPHIIGCTHVFCYYCLHSKYLLDPTDGFVCQQCRYFTKDRAQVLRYQKHEYLTTTE